MYLAHLPARLSLAGSLRNVSFKEVGLLVDFRSLALLMGGFTVLSREEPLVFSIVFFCFGDQENGSRNNNT